MRALITQKNDAQKGCTMQLKGITLKECITRTSQFRNGSKQLLLSLVKPRGLVSKDTISRWCKSVLSTAGVDVSKFKGYSTRAASPSLFADNNTSIRDITFQQYYHKPTESEFNFGEAILKSFATVIFEYSVL